MVLHLRAAIPRGVGDDDWPGCVARLVAKFGRLAVWNVGLERLGFPPTLVTGGYEVSILNNAFGA